MAFAGLVYRITENQQNQQNENKWKKIKPPAHIDGYGPKEPLSVTSKVPTDAIVRLLNPFLGHERRGSRDGRKRLLAGRLKLTYEAHPVVSVRLVNSLESNKQDNGNRARNTDRSRQH